MVDRHSTARSRTLGDVLAAIRTAAGLDVRTLAKKLEWEETKVYRVESGKRSIEDIELITWLTICGVGGAEIKRLTLLNRESTQDTWYQPAEQTSSGRTLSVEEQRATSIISYDLGLVPGLLQSKDYIAAVLKPPTEAVIASRLARQKLLRGSRALTATFYVDEQALRRVVGSREVMHDQLMHLLFAGAWANISLRVIMSDCGAHGATMGSFMILNNKAGKPLVFLETMLANIFLENAGQVARYELVAEELAGLALDGGQSREFITRLADGYGSSRGDRHGRGEDLA